MPAFDITPRLPAGRQLIQGYGNGGFTVSGQRHSGSLLILPRTVVGWAVSRPEDIDRARLIDVIREHPPVQILIVGCGERAPPPPRDLVSALRGQAIALEWMATGAACRTYNVLLLEDRPVAAALIAID